MAFEVGCESQSAAILQRGMWSRASGVNGAGCALIDDQFIQPSTQNCPSAIESGF